MSQARVRWVLEMQKNHVFCVRREKCDVAVASIYVNPTQFSANEDFGVYPRSEVSFWGTLWSRSKQKKLKNAFGPAGG